ncbi:MAG TPA: hypothetical protein VND65_22940 [Candidatus Binatia bacterium]|nr:hypothetical protein [Candidatus Binatia bacterium]
MVGRVTPPFGSSAWNKLNYIPDLGRFFIYSSDGIVTFSNSWWSYGVLGHVAKDNPWQEETTSGTRQTVITDNSKGFLKSAIGATDTAIAVGSGEAHSFHLDAAHGGILIVDDEEIAYSADKVSNDTFTSVTRGVRGTTPAGHDRGALVNAGAPNPQSRLHGSLVGVRDHLPDRHPFLSSAYDSRRHQLFQAGGIIEINKKSDTWYLCVGEGSFCAKDDVLVWKRLFTSTPAPAGADSAMTYDSDDDVMIVYGGQANGNPTSRTWLLCFAADPQVSGQSVGCPTGRAYPDWVPVNALSSPDPRFAHSIVYDSYHHVVVLFGGVNGTPRDPDETWIYAPATRTWKKAHAKGNLPASFRRPAMAYDSSRHKIVLYEGPDHLYLYDPEADTWELRVIPGGPVPSGGVAHGRLSLDYDSKNDMFVATELALPYALQTWELKGAALDDPKARR